MTSRYFKGVLLISVGIFLGIYSQEKKNHLQTMEMVLLFFEIKNHKIVLAQMAHETNLFTSKVFKENNNPFGFKCAEKRTTYCTGTNRGHATFKTIGYAILDYREWQDKYYPKDRVLTDEEYLIFLEKQAYAEDPSYLTKIRYWYRVIN